MGNELVLHCDGGMLGPRNPSPEGVYWSVYAEPPGRVVKRNQSRTYHTNNEAEWLALQEALNYALPYASRTDELTIYSDSQLIVNIFNGHWQAKDPRMQKMCFKCRDLATTFADCQVCWCPRREMVAHVGH